MTFKKYIFKNLWLQVVISLIVGLSVGLILGDDVGMGIDDENLDFATSYLKIPASIFVSLIYMIIVPLIFSSIVVAVNSLGTTEKLKTLGLGVASYFVITTTIAILVAVFLASLIAPGNILDISALQESYDLSDKDMKINEGFSLDDIPNAVANIIPKNPITSYLEGQMLSILVFALIIGLSMTAIPKESSKPVLDLLESIQKITLHILLFSMKIVPFAVFGLIVGMVSKIGLESMAGLGVYMITVVLGLGIMLSVYLIILKLVAKRPISQTFSKFRNPQTVSFSTASSMATMPVTLKTAEEELKASYVQPLDYGTFGENPVLIMELVPTKPTKQEKRPWTTINNGLTTLMRLPAAKRLELVAKVALAVAHMHSDEKHVSQDLQSVATPDHT